MAQRDTLDRHSSITCIISSRQEALERLSARIPKAQEIIERDLLTIENLELAERDFQKWDDYNVELLRATFSGTRFVDYYSSGAGYQAPAYPQLAAERLHLLRKDLGEKVLKIQSILEQLELLPIGQKPEPKAEHMSDRRHIFVVHGHDSETRESLARFIEKIGLQAIILHEQATGGRTIIEKLEHYSDVDFALVLLTPDDVGASQKIPRQLKQRARQNVILELGFFIGKLTRARVCAIYKPPLELPSDYIGVGYIEFDPEGAWKIKVVKELRAAGFELDVNPTTW